MKKTITVLLFLVVPYINAQEVIGYFNTTDGEKVLIHKNKDSVSDIDLRSNFIIRGNVTLTPERLFYFNASNEIKDIHQTKVEALEFNGRVFKNLSAARILGNRLHEIYISNDAFTLTNYSSNMGNYFYVFRNKDMKMIERRTQHSTRRKNDYESLEKIVKKYFSNCPEIFNTIKQNIRNYDYASKDISGNWLLRNNMFKGFTNYKCNEL